MSEAEVMACGCSHAEAVHAEHSKPVLVRGARVEERVKACGATGCSCLTVSQGPLPSPDATRLFDLADEAQAKVSVWLKTRQVELRRAMPAWAPNFLVQADPDPRGSQAAYNEAVRASRAAWREARALAVEIGPDSGFDFALAAWDAATSVLEEDFQPWEALAEVESAVKETLRAFPHGPRSQIMR